MQQKKNAGDNITGFTSEAIDMVREDFEELKEFFDGRYFRQAEELSTAKGHYFLTADELEAHRAIKDGAEKGEYLRKHAAPRIMPLWYLVVSLCRSLQLGEHTFSAHDAWWFGLIDEVPGSSLPSIRLWKEFRLRLKYEKASKKTPTPVSEPTE